MTEEQANPYNQRKEWHDIEEKAFTSSDSLFVPPKKPAREVESPDEESATSQDSVDWKKRYSDLKSHYDKDKVSTKQEMEQIKAQLKALSNPTEQPKENQVDMEDFKSRNEEVYNASKTIVEQEVNPLREELKELREREQKLKAKEAKLELLRLHPDFDTIVSDDEFHQWAEEQPQELQNWIYKNPDNASLAAKAIDFYKASKGMGKQAPQASEQKVDPNVDAASFIGSRATSIDSAEPKIWTRQEIKRLTPRQYAQYEAEIDQAILEGRVR